MFFSKTIFAMLLAVGAVNAAAIANPLDAGELSKRDCIPCGQFSRENPILAYRPKYPYAPLLSDRGSTTTFHLECSLYYHMLQWSIRLWCPDFITHVTSPNSTFLAVLWTLINYKKI
ncbi:predicted protein [Pyrenophora tritici-repentis Pt-1C-BFP]|uniref:Uncharacterized protein n=1 Tax=Pyrenophora tritici-repentis (strain Pt-1C-BFP) TaxID=426418 RepID=B2W0I7_PYRTR|nr:uncharacterized protein PTRG_03972 [Pyrenophora tritici-repentis Pt-1C-BFP]EDU46810.1 predicted protein [Pyrenophora tritici-repentis Pt-1C-BFP]